MQALHDFVVNHLLFALYVVWLLVAGTVLLTQRRSPAATLAWLFAFAALPVLSGLYYIVFGPRRLVRRRRRYGRRRAAFEYGIRDSLAPEYTPVSLTPLAETLSALGENLGQSTTACAAELALIGDGDACLDAIEQAISDTRHHVHAEYYIWEPDRTGTRVRDALTRAASRGVSVRVTLDGLGSRDATDAFWQPLLAAGGRVVRFLPLRLTLGSLNFANFRTHRKIVVCDGTVGFVGGMNLHEHISASCRQAAAWRDMHLRITGTPVQRLQYLFLENWVYSGGEIPVTQASFADYFPPAIGDSRHAVQIYGSGPDDERAPIHAFLFSAITSARSRVWITTPYLVPDEPMEMALQTAARRGVDVRVLVPREGDSWIVTRASRTYCESLRRAGVKIYEYLPSMLHAKTLIVDDSVAFVGTANFDNRSFRLNFEVGAACYDAGIVGELARRFTEDRARSQEFRLNRKEWLAPLVESAARLFSPVL